MAILNHDTAKKYELLTENANIILEKFVIIIWLLIDSIVLILLDLFFQTYLIRISDYHGVKSTKESDSKSLISPLWI